MVDIPGDNTTTVDVTVGSTTTGTLEIRGDHDWYRIQLSAGQSISVALTGVTLEDPYLRIRDSAGNIIYENDDISSGVNRDSLLAFTASYTGTYYIDVGAWNENYTGDFQVVVSNYSPPPAGTIDQFAAQLVSGYWGGDSHRFDVTQGGTITVNLTGLTSAGQNLAREALGLWSDVIGVTFSEVATGGQMTFDDNEEGAFSSGIWSGGIISSANVNVSTQWLTNYGTGFSSYSFQTYVHEIGHALGLGHAGNYNETARYPFDATYSNDAWPMSIMSYFDQRESTFYGNLGFTVGNVVTPMLADIVAMGQLYGLSTTTRTGDTTYGFNTNAGRTIYDASQLPSVSYTIVDSGGVDTLDYSGFSQNQKIYLTAETFSDIGGRVGNVSIGRGSVIENAIGGSGSDEITGNAANNLLSGGAGFDILRGLAGDDALVGGSGGDNLGGGDGADTFRDTAANMNNDYIIDFSQQDRIVITDANPASFSFSLSNGLLTYSGGQLTLGVVPTGTLVASAAAGGGVQLRFQTNEAKNDFNGDGRSDILWRHTDGRMTDWLGAANGGYFDNALNASTFVPTSWQVAGTGDFNGDGRSDILWRNADGRITDWLGATNGGFFDNAVNSSTFVPLSWQVVGTGDFNGDGRDDILWRNDDGRVTDWLGATNGGFFDNAVNASTVVPLSWNVAGTGDFNGDGRDDILWRHDDGHLINSSDTATGGFFNSASATAHVPMSWKIAGVGDFNGDGRDDILWRNDNGTLTNWLGAADGGFVPNDVNAETFVPTNWQVADIGDYNGDGRDDILWRHDDGRLTDWLGTANGGFFDNSANASTFVPTDWNVQSPDILL